MIGSVAGVRRIIGVEDAAELTDNEIQERLKDVEAEVSLDLGGLYVFEGFILRANSDGEFNRELTLWFSIKPNTTPSVYKNGVLLTEGTDYTYTTTTITLSDDLSITSYDEIIVKYSARIFDTYANYLVARDVLLTKTINLPSGSTTNYLLDNIEKKIDSLKKKINRRPIVEGWVEHYEDNGVW